MKVSEYSRVFGVEPYPVEEDEVIVDIGSGDYDLSALVPNGTIVQLDPSYRNASLNESVGRNHHALRLPVAIGDTDPVTTDTIGMLTELRPSRVTLGNTYKYISRDKRITALVQMLQLSRHGLLQIYPFRLSRGEQIATEAESVGFTVNAANIGVGGVRQAIFAAATINATLTVESQPRKAGPADHARLAKLIQEKSVH